MLNEKRTNTKITLQKTEGEQLSNNKGDKSNTKVKDKQSVIVCC